MAQRKRHKRGKRALETAREETVDINSIGAQGDGVAEVDGAVAYVPYTAPGDRAMIKRRGERGDVAALLEKSPYRREPPCPLFGDCGGCALQHLDEKFYRDWKRAPAVGALARAGFDENLVKPLVSCPPSSRRRARFAVQRTKEGLVFGFNARRSSRIVDVANCPILEPVFDEAIGALRGLAGAAPADWRKFDLSVTRCDNGFDVAFAGGDADQEIDGPSMLTLIDAARRAGILRVSVDEEVIVAFEPPLISFGGVPVTVPPVGFLQASREGEAALIDHVMAGVGDARRIADLFSGCGTFSLPLSKQAAVDAYDSDAPAIAALDAAARKSNLPHLLRAKTRNLFERPLTGFELKPYDAVIFDPPRAGAKAQAEQLAEAEIPVVVGVSCNPATFARDAQILRAGGYALTQVTPVDQFVYSPHVELVGIFTKG